MRLHQDRFTIEVADNGKGLAPTHNKDGHGLRNMAMRMDAIGGQLALLTPPTGGTTVRLEARIE